MDPATKDMFMKGKRQDLFNLWLKHARDFSQVCLEVSRTNLQRRSAHSNTVTWSRAQLEQSGRYTTEDINSLIERCTLNNHYIDDPNFPGVERLRRYIIVDEVGQSVVNAQEDTQRLSTSGQVTTNEALSLTGEGHWGQIRFVYTIVFVILQLGSYYQ